MLRCPTIHSSRPAVGLAHRSLIAFPLTPAPPLLGDPGARWQRPPPYYRRGHCPSRPNPTTAHYSLRPAGRAACLLGDEPIRIYVPLLTRPWIMQACNSTSSCHLGTARTLRMLERFYWWIGMSICTRWRLCHCLKGHARQTLQLTVQWSVISIPLSPGPGIAVSVDCFWSFPVTPRGNTYICFSPIALAVVRTCSPSPPLDLQLKARPTSLSPVHSPLGVST